jgi:uncharacterized protein YaiI (UPF0178 family)
MGMHIWVDADACPLAVKEILYRAAERAQLRMTLVANKLLGIPRSPWISSLQVARGFDVADNEIAKRMEAGDLVITADIPLAADVVARGGHAINPRGEIYTTENIRERLATRDFLEKLRETGVQTGGPAPLDHADRKRFADQLDRFLARAGRG